MNRDEVVNRIRKDWLTINEVSFNDKLEFAQNEIDNATFDEMLENFEYYHAAQCFLNTHFSSLTPDPTDWYVAADEFIKSFKFNDEDMTMLKLAWG